MRKTAPMAILMLAFALALRGDDDLERELPRIPPTEAKDALKTFRVHPGFRLEIAASEPIVTDPVSACFDADGRLYVVEMRGYPYPEKVASGNVSLLEDRDGDGVFDKRTVFVDGLSWPTSVVPYDGGVFIAVAPDILYAKDTDGDGKADVRKVMFSGFGTQNVQALVNGLLWGVDGWIYGASGGNGRDIKSQSRPDAKPVSVRGRDFRFRPDGSAFEATSGGGQFGHTIDDWGHRFVCNNSNNIRQVVLPARELERNPALAVPSVTTDIASDGPAGPVYRISPPEPWRVVRTRQRLADPAFAARLAPTEKFAAGFFTSATGVTIYRGTAYPPEYRGNAFIGDVGGNLVHRKTLARDGAIFRADRADEKVEFAASTDNWFRPVNFLNTPDGTLYILDMYRETIEHPASIPEPIKKHLDLTSGHDRGRIYHLIPDGFRRRGKPALSKATTAELVALLSDPDAWWRETAQRLLIERKDESAIPRLRVLLSAKADAAGILGRAHALWTLDILGALDAEDILTASRVGDDPRTLVSEPGLREQLAALAGPRADRSRPLRELLGRLASDPDAMVRFRVALALGDVRDEKAVEILTTLVTRSGDDPWTRAAVESALAGRTTALINALSRSPGFFETAPGRSWLQDLATLVGAEGDREKAGALLGRFSEAEPAIAGAVVLGLARGLSRSGKSLSAVLDEPTTRAVRPLFDRAAERARAGDEVSRRVEAVRLVGLGPVDLALETLPALLEAREPSEVQLAALQALAALKDHRVGEVVTRGWNALGPALKREAIEVLLSRPDRVSALLDAVEAKTISPTDLDPLRRKQLLDSPDLSRRRRAQTLLGSARSDRAAILAAYRNAATRPGDPGNGRDLFQKHCATCHKAEGRGNDVGPNLATVAGRTAEDLLVHILDPNREVPPASVSYTIATTDGRVLSGLIAEETGASVTLKRAEGATDLVPRSRIEALTSSGLSLMPEGLEKAVGDVSAMADLIAYIRSLTPTGGGTKP